jgi:hypothetical protein
MLRFKEYLVEADTTGATSVEMAICFYWNKTANESTGISDEEALSLAEIPIGKWNKVTDNAKQTGQNIVKLLPSEGVTSGNAVHYGGGSDKVSAFWSKYGAGAAASSRTPKTDLIIGTKTISLKIGAGQLMSGKGPEATATFFAALEEAGDDLKKSREVNDCITEIKKFSEGYIKDTITNMKKNNWATAPLEIINVEQVHKNTMQILGTLFEKDKKFQKAFIKEAMTGNVKFGKSSKASADYFLVGSKDGTAISFHDIDKGDYVDKVISRTTISVKHKTTSEQKVVGGVKVKTGRRKWWSALGLSTKDMTKTLKLNNSYDPLDEGFFRDIWNKVKSTVTGFVVDMKKIAQRKFRIFLSFLGFEPEVEYEIKF